MLDGSDQPVFDPAEHLRILAERWGLSAEELEQLRRQRCSALSALR